ncbi:MAG TPA: thioredoxin-like domain-containing protein, partial [Armatimonadota bacterium]|nr:thioredoxin-like domain-containing protein [Armatimonadota bacterium]
DAAWLNTAQPLSLRALRGKIVLLDFWTYGCINCMHILPDLKKLERKYPNELVVISVHSAKFKNEDETANIRNALLRYNIEHPVLNDAGLRMWNAYGVNAWPTLMVIDAAGRVVGGVSGEGHYAVLDRAIGDAVREARLTGLLNVQPISFALEAARVPATPLWYPGKVLADAASGRLFIADSNHNRIVIAKLNGEVEAVAGTGVVGKEDGAFDTARFASPQGMALRRGDDGTLTLYVADTNNHAIRALDLKRGTVTTVAGTGRQAKFGSTGGVGTATALASPWDLLLVGNSLYIAMAGPHQIWRMDLPTKSVRPYAGSGREAKTDGPLPTSAFAQPSGLATDGKRLFVADSEISAIRAVDLPGAGRLVRTLAGGDLFEFGDRDGVGAEVRLQHPLGVDYLDGVLYLADTYNHKIKTLDPATGRVTGFLGGERGNRDGNSPQFYEPGGISIAGGKLYVADTNNHRIRVVDLAKRTTTTLALKNLPAPLPSEPERSVRPASEDDGTITLPPAQLAPGGAGELVLDLKLPAGHKLNPGSPQRFQARAEGTGVTLSRGNVPTAEFKLPLRVPLSTGAAGGKGAVVVSTTVFYCSDSEGTCKIKSLRFRAPFEVRAGGAQALTVNAEVK